MNLLVTGVAGFIGFHLTCRLLREGHEVTGIDNINDYYDVRIKQDRLKQIQELGNFTFKKLDLADRAGMEALFAGNQFERVINLAAQAG